MNARSTRSGTISALMEPCRKNARSSADHAGTWAVSTSPAGRAAAPGRSPELVQAVSSITSPMTTRARGRVVAVMRRFYGRPPGADCNYSCRAGSTSRVKRSS